LPAPGTDEPAPNRRSLWNRLFGRWFALDQV
jgi:hypothetical protein